jgi:hypothetical protein
MRPCAARGRQRGAAACVGYLRGWTQSAPARGAGQPGVLQGELEFLRDLVKRALRPPLTMTSDGVPGMRRALEEVFLLSVRIRSWMHKMQNVLAYTPAIS